jgi:hypothetical protein
MRIRPVFIVLLASAMIVTAVAVGCNALAGSFERDSDEIAELHAAARSFVPAGAPVVAERESACYHELGAYPDCVMLFFRARGALADRAEATRSAAAANGWRRGVEHGGGGGVQLTYARDGLVAIVALDAREYFWRRECGRRSLGRAEREECADSVQIRFD